MKLAHKNIVITGASRGLGKAIAEECWREGANLLLVARSAPALSALHASLQSSPVLANQQAHVFAADLNANESTSKIRDHTYSIWPAVHGLVNNAGIIGPVGKSWNNDWPLWQRTLRVNLLAPVELCRALLPWMIACGSASIINLSGGGATGPRPNFSAYATAKTGLVRFTEILAKELEGSGVRANSIAPGAMATDMLKELLDAGIDNVGADEFNKVVKQAENGGTPPELAAKLCVFLLSDEASEISGKLLSAQWDPWQNLGSRSAELKTTDIYTLRRIVPEDRGMKWE